MRKSKIQVYYDKEGDALEIVIGKPLPATYQKTGVNLFARVDDTSGETTGYTVFNVTKQPKV